LQLSTNDFENAESIWAGETPDSQGVTQKKNWYGLMSAQPAALPGKGQTHMPALLLTALKKQVPLVPQMRQDWATAFKAESAGKKCCVRDATMSKAKCGIFDESESCPPDSRWQRGSALGDLGAVNKAAVGGCCGPNQWKKTSLNSFTGGSCEVIGCLVTDIQPNGLGGEKVLLMGTHFEGTSKALEYMQENVDGYKTRMEEKAVTKLQGELLNAGRAPIVKYTVTFTLDIESSPPGFCTPSSSLLQVVGSISWSGSTADKKPMDMEACMSARVHPPNFYIMLTFCYGRSTDLLESSGGLDSIDDGKNSTQNFGKRQSTTKVTVNTFAYLAKATPLAPDPSITEIVKPLMELFKAGGTQAIGGALASSSSSGSVPSLRGLMKIAMAAPTVGVTSALMMEPGPLEGFAEGFAAVGMATGAIAVC